MSDREARLAAILNTAADAIITIDDHGGIQSVNLAAERMFDYAAAEMIGQNVKMLMPAPYQEEHDDYLSRYSQTGEKHIIGVGREVVGRRKGGSTFPMELAVSEVGDRKLFTGIIRDISRRKDLEREIVEIASLEQLRIGQDLHDTVSQELSAIGMMADDLTEILQTNPVGGSKIAGANRPGNEAQPATASSRHARADPPCDRVQRAHVRTVRPCHPRPAGGKTDMRVRLPGADHGRG